MLALAITAVPALGANATSYSGRATVVDVDVNNPVTGADLADLVLADTGPLPAGGGSRFVEVLSASNPAPIALTASILRARTEGAGSTALSVARAANLTLDVADVQVSSTTLRSTATAVCGADGAVVSGDSVIEDLVIEGQAITVTGAPNQTVDIGPIHIVINEQTRNVTADGSYGEITVTALHITVDNPLVPNTLLAEVILSRAHADVACPAANGGPDGEIGGPCADPAYYGIFDNTDGNRAFTFRFRWNSGTVHTFTKTVPAGAIFRTRQWWVKPFTTLRVSYFNPATNKWVTLDQEQSVKGNYPPCVYKVGFSYPNS